MQILNSIDPSQLFDLQKTFGDQKKRIEKKLLPAVQSAMNPSLKVYGKEIVNIIRQLHKSRREIWKKQNDGRFKDHCKRQHAISRRDQV